MEPALLGGATPARFLQRYWQKQPLLIRQAIAGFQGLLSARELFALAGRDDVESRLVLRERRCWTLAQGPFRRADFGRGRGESAGDPAVARSPGRAEREPDS